MKNSKNSKFIRKKPHRRKIQHKNETNRKLNYYERKKGSKVAYLIRGKLSSEPMIGKRRMNEMITGRKPENKTKKP